MNSVEVNHRDEEVDEHNYQEKNEEGKRSGIHEKRQGEGVYIGLIVVDEIIAALIFGEFTYKT